MSNMDFIRGVGIGVIAGGSIGIALAASNRRSSKKSRAMKTIGQVVGNVTDALGM